MGYTFSFKKESNQKRIEKQIQPPKIMALESKYFISGGESFMIIEMLGDFRATPFARLILNIFEEGFSKEIDHLSLLGFFQSWIKLEVSEKAWERVSSKNQR